MKKDLSANLTRGPVWRALVAMSAPMSFGIFAVSSVGLADAYFLSQLGGEPLAAVGFIYPMTTALTSLSIGLSAGANTALSQGVGRGEEAAQTRRLGLHAIGLGLSLSLIVGGLVHVLYPQVFSLLGAGKAVSREIALCMPLWALSFPFLVTMMVANAIFRAHGDGLTAPIIMSLAAAVNVALDPLLTLSAGIGPVVGQNWGADKQERARQSTRIVLILCLGYGAFTGLVLAGFARTIAGLLTSGEDDLAFAVQYLRYVGASLFGYGFVIVANAAMNARDKAMWSMSLSLS